MFVKADVMWWVQSNLGKSTDLVQALINEGILWAATPIVPWFNETPNLGIAAQGRQIIYYGSISTIEAIRGSSEHQCGIWQDPDIFKPSKCFEMWEDLCLNYQAEVITIREFLDGKSVELCFIKPNNDMKSFSGRSDYGHNWKKELSARGEDLDLEIVVSESQVIDQEWRFWVIDDRIVTGSKYKERGWPCTRTDIDSDWVDAHSFAEKLKGVWNPTLAYCFNIGRIGNKYRLVELTGINSAGFYAADVRAIVAELTRIVKERR